jgi:hypothetical protein
MSKTIFLFFLMISFLTTSALASNMPNTTNTSNEEAPLELFEEDENAIPAFLENEEESENSERESLNEDSEWLEYLCDGTIVFVKSEDRQWYDENCTQVLDK